MKKIVPLLLIILFALFGYFGFQAATKLFSNPNKTSNTQQQTPILPSTQQNYLLIHITDLASESPDLVAVWVVFVYYADPPQLMFMPFYPSYDATRHEDLTRSYALSSDKSVSGKFINQVEQTYDIQVSGYLLSDNTGVSYANNWLNNSETQSFAAGPVSDEEKQLVLSNGRASFDALCQRFISGGGEAFFSSITWADLLPRHFATDLPFESIILTTDLLRRAPAIPRCVVLSGQ